MSVRVMTRVWNHSKHKKSERLVLLAIADRSSGDDGTGAWPSQADIAERTGLTDRQVRTILRKLEASGELRIEPPTNGHRTPTMTVLTRAEETSGCTCYGCSGDRKKLPLTPEAASPALAEISGLPGSPLPTNRTYPSSEPSSSAIEAARKTLRALPGYVSSTTLEVHVARLIDRFEVDAVSSALLTFANALVDDPLTLRTQTRRVVGYLTASALDASAQQGIGPGGTTPTIAAQRESREFERRRSAAAMGIAL